MRLTIADRVDNESLCSLIDRLVRLGGISFSDERKKGGERESKLSRTCTKECKSHVEMLRSSIDQTSTTRWYCSVVFDPLFARKYDASLRKKRDEWKRK